jgi:rRNA maturation endonuclease Nob1
MQYKLRSQVMETQRAQTTQTADYAINNVLKKLGRMVLCSFVPCGTVNHKGRSDISNIY